MVNRAVVCLPLSVMGLSHVTEVLNTFPWVRLAVAPAIPGVTYTGDLIRVQDVHRNIKVKVNFW